jgi:hypothetical protein
MRSLYRRIEQDAAEGAVLGAFIAGACLGFALGLVASLWWFL